MDKYKWKDHPNSLINRWLNDNNPVGIDVDSVPSGEKATFRKIAEEDRETYLKEKFNLKE